MSSLIMSETEEEEPVLFVACLMLVLNQETGLPEARLIEGIEIDGKVFELDLKKYELLLNLALEDTRTAKVLELLRNESREAG